MFSNEGDIDNYVNWFALDDTTPNLKRAALTLEALASWANNNSDGWAYWNKPMRASQKLQELLDRYRMTARSEQLRDCTPQELAKTLTPIKSFLTRHDVEHAEVIR